MALLFSSCCESGSPALVAQGSKVKRSTPFGVLGSVDRWINEWLPTMSSRLRRK